MYDRCAPYQVLNTLTRTRKSHNFQSFLIKQATRVGRFVNDVRKQIAQQWPEFSKRCRALIKQWQKIAEYRPGSSCEGSSNGGTPQLVSPALRRGLTPRTTTGGGSKRVTPQQPQPKQRVTSTGLLPPGGFCSVFCLHMLTKWSEPHDLAIQR